MVERNQKGDMWYRIGPGQWLYGPHLSFSQEGSYQSFSNYGYGYVKDDAVLYHLNKDDQMIVPKSFAINCPSFIFISLQIPVFLWALPMFRNPVT